MSALAKKYDVVISFTEEQKDIAVSISLALEQLGINVYYYPYKEEENIGKDLGENLIKIYQYYAILAVAILSEEYFLKKFTLIELRAIRKRLQREPDYLIPVLHKNTELPDYLNTLTYIHWMRSDPKSIAEVIKKRIERKVNVYLESDPLKIKTLSKNTLLTSINRLSKFKSLNNADFHFRLGLYHYYLSQSHSDLQKSIEHFHQATIVSPSFHQAFYWLSRVTIECKNLSRIRYVEIKAPVDWLIKAIQLDPTNQSYFHYADEISRKYFKKHGLKNPFKTIRK